MKRGRFITLEGGEGTGKTTNMETVLDVLGAAGIETVATREPGGTLLGERLRDVLLDPDVGKISVDAELLIMFAARAEHIQRVIAPALVAGKWVVSDRFTDASYAYQGGGRGMPGQRIQQIEEWVQGDLQPDMTLLLDAPIDVGMSRARKRGALDRFEQENPAFSQQVRDGYLSRAGQHPHRFKIIEASQSLEDVQAAVRNAVQAFVNPTTCSA